MYCDNLGDGSDLNRSRTILTALLSGFVLCTHNVSLSLMLASPAGMFTMSTLCAAVLVVFAVTGYSSGAGCEQDRYLIIPPGPSSALNHSVGFRTARGPCTNSGMALPSVLDQACMQSLLAQIRLHYSADFAFWVNTSQVVNSSGVTGAAGAGMAGMPGSIPPQHQLVCIGKLL